MVSKELFDLATEIQAIIHDIIHDPNEITRVKNALKVQRKTRTIINKFHREYSKRTAKNEA